MGPQEKETKKRGKKGKDTVKPLVKVVLHTLKYSRSPSLSMRFPLGKSNVLFRHLL